MRLDFFRRLGGLYPFNVAGPNDSILAEGMSAEMPKHSYAMRDGLHPDFLESIQRYQANASASLRSPAKCVSGCVSHLHHGTPRERYLKSAAILRRHQFTPADVIHGNGGVLEWNTSNEDLRREIKEWFTWRGQAR